jgi:hypothetical protein
MRQEAEERVKEYNPQCSGVISGHVYAGFLGGILIDVVLTMPIRLTHTATNSGATNPGPGLPMVGVCDNRIGKVLTTPAGNRAVNHVHFVNGRAQIYTNFGDVCHAVTRHQPNLFFRFLEFSGVGGAIASFLVIIFAVLLCVLALGARDANSSILDIVKTSFTIILGYFFGSQSRRLE